MHEHRIFITGLFAMLVLAASSCGVGADMAFRADRSASLALSVEVPQAVEARLRQFAASAPRKALFDAAAIAASISARGVSVRESVSPDPRSWRGAFNIPDLEKLLAGDKDLASVLSFSRGPGWASIRLRVDRSNASALVRLLPGLDMQLLEALQPPALFDNPVNASEYRAMLAGLLGKSAVAALDGASVVFSASFPGAVTESSGGLIVDAAGRTASFTVPAIRVMVLEQPIELYLRWKE